MVLRAKVGGKVAVVDDGCREGAFLSSQFQLHIERACNRIHAIGSDFLESDFAVHGDSVFHHRADGIETHAMVANLAGFRDDRVGEDATEPLTTKFRAQVEALHLADAGFEFVESYASADLIFITCK